MSEPHQPPEQPADSASAPETNAPDASRGPEEAITSKPKVDTSFLQTHVAATPASGQAAQADTGIVVLPTPATPSPGIAAEPEPKWFGGFDRVLAVLLLVLTFLLGSFAANNSDVFMQLASGRLIAQGEWTIGVDPFSWASRPAPNQPGVTWVHHSWLYSWGTYLLYSWFGGAALVVLKALVGVLTILLLMQIRPPGSSLWLSVVLLALTALVLSFRLLLQPIVVSYLLLASLLYLLYRGGALGGFEPGGGNPKLLNRVPFLFLLWVNVDAWFAVGLLVLLLLWIGTGLSRFFRWSSDVPGLTLAKVFGASVLLCLINPHHVGVFQLPPELAYLARVLRLPDFLVAGGTALFEAHRIDPSFIPMTSPLSRQFWANPLQGWNLAGVALWALLLVSLLSFVVLAGAARDRASLHPGRLLLWLAFTALGLLQFRLISFFALLAGPVAILNFAEARAWREKHALPIQLPNWRPLKLARLLTFVVFLVLLFFAWPGWLHVPVGEAQSSRRVRWALAADPSLEQAAREVGRRHQEGKVQRLFNFSPDLANYCAWFAPGVQSGVDSRLTLFPHMAVPYFNTRLALMVDAMQTRDQAAARREWQKTFAHFNIDHVALTSFQQPNIRGVGAMMWLDARHWQQLYGDGRTVVFAWSAAGDFTEELSADLSRKVFGPVPQVARAPAQGAPLPEGPPSIWEEYLFGPPPESLIAAEGNLWISYFQTLAGSWYPRFYATDLIAQAAQPAALAGAAPGGILLSTLASAWANEVYPFLYSYKGASGRPFLHTRDNSSPAAPLYLVRKTRQALADNPNDPLAYLTLYDACKTLSDSQEEFWANYNGQAAPGFRYTVRLVQMVNALAASATLRPDNADIHAILAEHFLNQHYLDVALEHLRVAVQLNERARLSPSAQKTQEMRKQFLANLEQDVAKRLDDYKLKTAGKKPLEKVQYALFGEYRAVDAKGRVSVDPRGRGLALEALKRLQALKIGTLSREEQRGAVILQLRLTIQMGRAGDAVEVLTTSSDSLKGLLESGYYEFLALTAAARGDYKGFDEAVAQLETYAQETGGTRLAGEIAQQAFGLAVLDKLPLSARVIQGYKSVREVEQRLLERALPVANFRTLRGIFALEQGDTERARRLFEEALALAGPDVSFPDRPIAERYLELLARQQKGGK